MHYVGDVRGRTKYCEHCVYYGKYTKSCGYYLITKERRCEGHDPKYCTKYKKGTPVYDKNNWRTKGIPKIAEIIDGIEEEWED